MRTVKLRSTTPTWLYINYEASAFLVCFDCQSSRTDLFVVKRGSLLNTTARKQKSWCLPQQCFFCVCVCVGGGFTYISGLSFEIDITSELKKIMEHLSKRNQDGMGSSSGEHAVSTQQKRESTRLLEEPFEAKLCSLYSSKNFFKPQELQASWAHVCRGQCTEHGSSPPLGKKLCHLPPHTHTTCNSGNAVLLKRWNTLLTPEDQRGIKKNKCIRCWIY